MNVFLESPDGTVVELFTDIGGQDDNLVRTSLGDGAVQSIDTGVPPFTGRFRPEGQLQSFRGERTDGIWVLHVTDDTTNGEAGTLVSWSLELELAMSPAGNLNHDGGLDATDIDQLFANLSSTDPTYDLDYDGNADTDDVDELVLNMMGKRFGDTDLDQDVDIFDFNALAMNFDPVGNNPFNGWAQGNFDGDSDVDISDFNKLARNFAPPGYTALPTRVPAAADGTTFISSIEPDELVTKSVADSPVDETASHTTAPNGARNSTGDPQLRAVRQFEIGPHKISHGFTIRGVKSRWLDLAIEQETDWSGTPFHSAKCG